MEVRFKNKSDVFNVLVTIIAAVVSVGTMIYGVLHLGIAETWPELVLNVFYIACVTMLLMYFFNGGITTKQFNYWSTLNIGITVLLRDILFAPPLANYPLHLACLTLSVALILSLTFFYARKDWKTYSKRNLWFIFLIDLAIALLYNVDILIEPINEYSTYLMVEIWIRPTITYGLVACYVKGTEEK
ncbi:MAG: hypothetical protein IJ627_03340 [Bacteroidales bacterium]|nr:hypothetical protein [Bacteroidales bacterium]